MNIKEIQQEILKLKKEKDICILAHSYQSKEIIEVADFTGDSYQLSVMATEAPQKTVIMCGVKFMAACDRENRCRHKDHHSNRHSYVFYLIVFKRNGRVQ